MKKIINLILGLFIILSLASCDNSNINIAPNPDDPSINNSNTNNDSTNTNQEEIDITNIDDDMFTNRDSNIDYSTNDSINITLNNTSISCNNSSVIIDSTSTTITKEATYIITGSLTNGIIIIDAENAKLQLVLDNVNIENSTSTAIYVKNADKVFLTLVGENKLSNSTSFIQIDDNNLDGVIFSKDDITINGTGSLEVESSCGHGVVGKDDIKVTGGNINITSSSHAISANDSVRIKDSTLTLKAGKDGIKVENEEDLEKGFIYVESGNINIESEGDGISASSYIKIDDGNFNLNAGGGYTNGSSHSSNNWGGMPGGPRPGSSSSTTTTEDDSTSMKGIKASNSLLINGGTFIIDSADDSIHSNTSVTITNGNFAIASGDDGVHADNNLNITNGTIIISNSYEGLEALNINISGGNIILSATDDGLNSAGGTDSSGTGGRDNMFGRPTMGSANSNGSIIISGSTLYIKASGDGIDANGTLEISGGYITVVGPTQGDTATLDFDVSGTITGGTFIGTGSANMAQTFSSNTQGVISLSVGNITAGTKITLVDENNKEIISYAPELAYQIVILSSPEIISGNTYTITIGTQTKTVTAK